MASSSIPTASTRPRSPSRTPRCGATARLPAWRSSPSSNDLGQRTNGLDMALHAAEDSCVRYLLTTTWPPAALDAEDALSVSEILNHYHTRLVTVDGQPPQEQPDDGTDDGWRQS